VMTCIGVDAFDHVNMATLPEIMGTFSENSTAMLFLYCYAFSLLLCFFSTAMLFLLSLFLASTTATDLTTTRSPDITTMFRTLSTAKTDD
jgi:prepilin signal peptidase PulO-like enzyme (type II secretory pathway)